VNPLRKAAVFVADYAYAAFWQARALVNPVQAGRYATAGASKQPVVILPGIYETWQFMRPLADYLRELGHPVHVVTALRRNTGEIPASADLVLDYLRSTELRNVIIVAHSKGGLIGKYAMIHDTQSRIDRMIAIATPFSGSSYARFMLTPALRAFSPTDAMLRTIGEQLEVNSRITSIAPRFDTHIPNGSELAGATNIRLRGSGHFKIIDSAEVKAIIADAVSTEAR